MEDVLSKLLAVSADPYKSVTDWKERTGKKVMGCFPMHIPEELVHASGALPVNIWRSNELISQAHAYIRSYSCGLVRSFLDDVVRGKVDFMDGMAFTATCIQVRALPSIIQRNHPPAFMECIYLPQVVTGINKELMMRELKRLVGHLEKFSGQRITPEAIIRSIAVYNKNRSLLRRLYELRSQKPTLLRAKEMVAIVQAGMLMPKEEHNKMLEQLLADLQKRPVPADGRAARIFVVGHLCHAPRSDVLDLIEDAGGVVVGDDLYAGSRYYVQDALNSKDPLESLADRYLSNHPPCPTLGDIRSYWGDYIADAATAVKAQGVINLVVKFCPPHYEIYPRMKERIEDRGLPHIMFELEHEAVSLEGIRTRMQAFMETLRRD